MKLNHPGLYIDRGYIYKKMGLYEKALADFNKALEFPDEKADSHRNLAILFHEQGNYQEALMHFEESYRLDPQSNSMLNDFAWLLSVCNEEKCRNGKRALEFALKVNENTNWESSQYLDTLAAAYAEMGDFDSAVKWQSKALELSKTGDSSAQQMKERLQLYKDQKPYREELKKSKP